jgi:hypothetical protein
MPYISPIVNGYIDDLVKTVTQAGLRIGFCVRDCFYQLNTATGKWVPAPYTDERTRRYDLGSKISYARNRWGATLIYLDSFSGTATTLQKLAQDFPSVLLMPEQGYPARWIYQYAAPFEMVNLYRDQTRWDDRQAIPTARQVSYAANQPFDGSTRAGEIQNGILHGDILMVRSWWTGGSDWQFARDLISKGAW